MDLDLKPISNQEAKYYMSHNHYVVTGILARPGSHTYTKRVSIVCRDLNRAIELAIKEIPGLEVQSVAHQGQIQKVEI